jgi:hypothetical protein
MIDEVGHLVRTLQKQPLKDSETELLLNDLLCFVKIETCLTRSDVLFQQ